MLNRDFILIDSDHRYVKSLADMNEQLVIHWTSSAMKAQHFTKATAETLAMNYNWHPVLLTR